MKSITIQEAARLIEDAVAVLCDDMTVLFPIVNTLTGDPGAKWLECMWSDDDMDYEFHVTEAPQEILFDGANIYLKDSEGEDTTITPLHRGAPTTEKEFPSGFDPFGGFDSPDNVVGIVNEIPLAEREDAFWAVVQANARMGECGFAGEVVALYEDLELSEDDVAADQVIAETCASPEEPDASVKGRILNALRESSEVMIYDLRGGSWMSDWVCADPPEDGDEQHGKAIIACGEILEIFEDDLDRATLLDEEECHGFQLDECIFRPRRSAPVHI